ncbi:dicarboxylate/amino acid:cation symporter [Pacificimonas flava]|uniref:Proton/glutamate symport protein n=1 Tax=Pacificimonas flava TaxID=1234595 RepID=M2U7A3_9SPHN|nr:dicarboxylate/amino acid:cation symporter [Pacificimonas flava]EMD83887.1 Proton/glutamate symport protein [Pacificimonas flava]MBB5281138.1 Na+/H+-dicarboxylate symporter [Pacificimonas flava]
MLKAWFAIPLWQRVIGALVLGVVTGLAWGPGAESIKFIGDLFIAAIKMLVVPLIFFSLVSGVAAVGDVRKLGAVGGRALLFFFVTGAISVAIGLALGTFLHPGTGLSIPLPENYTAAAEAFAWRDMVLRFVPENVVNVMSTDDILPLITFTILFGVGILIAGDDGLPMIRAMNSGAVVMEKVTMLVMELTPFGVFALIAWVAGTFGLDALIPLAKLVGLNYLGCGLLLALVYPSIIRIFTKLPVADFYRGILDAMAVSYSTASSNATIPVTLRCAQRNLGVSTSVSSFVVSLGATVNMNGTAMYLGLVSLFGAQAFGITLGLEQYLLIAITGTLGAIGTAGVPGAGLIMMGLVLGAAGIPLETIALVAGINHIMDMMRTMTNVTGDATVTVATAHMMGEIDVEEYVSADDV